MPIAIALAPSLIAAALEIYRAAAADPQTPADKRAQYEAVIQHLEAADAEVQSSPLPDEGSGVGC